MSRFALQPCRWRRPSPIAGRQLCASPIVNAGVYGVMDHQCFMCPEADHIDQAAAAAAADQAGAVRHLLYHVYPFGARWRRHMEVLRTHAGLFNGRRVVGVAVGPETATADEVAAELVDLDVDLVVVPNDPSLRELATYPLLLERISEYASPADCHFYGHAKGVSSAGWGPAADRWADAMYEALLGHWPAVRRELQGHAAVGVFRRLWEGPLRTRAKWHYSGAFRWVRNADLFSRSWRTIDRNWLGAETHVGLHFGRGESSCLYGEFGTQDCGLYAHSEWERWAEPQRQAWLAAHVQDLQQPLLATVILTAHRQPELVHEAVASVRGQDTDAWQLLIVDSGAIAAAGGYERYAGDARVSVMVTGETATHPADVGRQAWAINQAWRRRRVRGDLVVCLSDDDRLAPTWLGRVLAAARARPEEAAWCGVAELRRRDQGGGELAIGKLQVKGCNRSLRGVIDGMQMAVRRSAWHPWPEGPEFAREADGYWMDLVAAGTAVLPLPDLAGVHRHTPLSTFTTHQGPVRV